MKGFIAKILLLIIPFTLLLPAAGCAGNKERKNVNREETYTNPLSDDGLGYSDPWVIYVNGYYYYCGSDGKGTIFIKKSAALQNILTQQKTDIYTTPADTNYSNETWAPELHYLGGKWYVYFAADNGSNENHRTYCLEGGTNADDPLDGAYTFKSQLKASTDKWAIDGTAFEYENQLYFVWSGWEGDVNVSQNLYIAKMSNPYTLSGERVEISVPEYDWEKNGTPTVNEGPEALIHNGTLCIIYSASGSWTDDYCLGQLKLTGTDLLNKSSWTKKSTPVFQKTDKVFGPGHASFVKSPDGKEDWIVYHAAVTQGSGWTRDIRIQKFNWNSDNTPNFGKPVDPDVPLPVPAGSPSESSST